MSSVATRSFTTRAVLALARSEVRLLWRNRVVGLTALVLPLALGVAVGSSDVGQFGGWGGTIAYLLLSMMLLTVYMSATTAVAARRSGLVLKRLRSGEIPEPAILAGMLLPTVVLAMVQAVLLSAMLLAFGASSPEQPLLVLLGTAVGVAMCTALALATTRITTTAEMAQVTTLPFFFAALAGGFWAITTPIDESSTLMVVNPGGAVVHLVRAGWDGGGDPLLAAAALVGWTALAFWVAARTFRWEPRT